MKTPPLMRGQNILARRLIKKTLLLAFLTTVLLTIAVGSMAFHFEKKSLEQQFQKIESSYIDSIRPALWISDKEMIEALLMGIGDFHEIGYAGIYSNGDLIAETGVKTANQKMDGIFPITHLYDGKTYQLGELHVQKNHDFVEKQIFRIVFIAALTQAFTIFIICGAVLWLMFHSMIQRLLAITRYTSTLSMKTLDKPLVIDKSSQRPDELDTLADTIDKMRQNLLHELIGRKKAEAQLQEHLDNLEKTVEKRTADLQAARSEVKTLSGLLPICMHCKKIRDDQGYWKQMETYIHEHSDAQFSHSICRECAEKFYPDLDIYEDENN
jgi:methyl-accepting chemotaxis protein